jgi:hypothetical protein
MLGSVFDPDRHRQDNAKLGGHREGGCCRGKAVTANRWGHTENDPGHLECFRAAGNLS